MLRGRRVAQHEWMVGHWASLPANGAYKLYGTMTMLAPYLGLSVPRASQVCSGFPLSIEEAGMMEGCVLSASYAPSRTARTLQHLLSTVSGRRTETAAYDPSLATVISQMTCKADRKRSNSASQLYNLRITCVKVCRRELGVKFSSLAMYGQSRTHRWCKKLTQAAHHTITSVRPCRISRLSLIHI